MVLTFLQTITIITIGLVLSILITIKSQADEQIVDETNTYTVSIHNNLNKSTSKIPTQNTLFFQNKP